MHPTIRILTPALALFCALAASAQTTFFPDELIVTASALNLRDKPEKSGKVVEKLPRGSSISFLEAVDNGAYVEVDSVYGTWLKVKSPANKTGFVFSPYVTGAYNIYLEGNSYIDNLPDKYWYGVYMRDSFTDELRAIQVRLANEYNAFREEEIPALRTNQRETSKFIIGTNSPLKPGLAGNLGNYNPGNYFYTDYLAPGVMLAIYPGSLPDDTISLPTYFLASTGCAVLNADNQVVLQDFQLRVMTFPADLPPVYQDLSPWFSTEPGINPSLTLRWYGDVDGDRKPDALIEDAPQEMGVRVSLFLSSKARPGELLHKVCEYWLPLD